MSIKIEKLPIEPLELGEGPHWDIPNQCLYFVDIPAGQIHRYVPATKKHTKATISIDTDVSIMIPLEGHKDKFVIGFGKTVSVVTWDGESDKISDIQKIASLEDNSRNKWNKFNDGKCDPTGKLWIGTVGFDESKSFAMNNSDFYSLEPNGQLVRHITDITVSNGLAWNAERKKFYHVDSPAGTVKEFDYDINKGTISNGKVILTTSKHNLPGMPDGMAIDTEGNLWVAMFNGQQILKIDPRKPESIVQSIKIPALQVTSLAFGGANFDELFVTTGRLKFGEVDVSGPDNGCVYKITGTGAKGLPNVNFKYNL